MNDDFADRLDPGFQISDSIPADYRGPVLSGGKVKSLSADDWSIIVQENRNDFYLMQYNHFSLSYPFRILTVERNYVLHALLILKNKIELTIEGIGNFLLREGEIALLHAPEKQFTFSFSQAGEHRIFETYFTKNVIDQLASIFPRIKEFLDRSDREEAFVYPGNSGSPGIQARSVVNDLLHADFREDLRRFYYETKLREYLFLLLARSEMEKKIKVKLSEDEIESIYKLKSMLANNPGRHLTIPILAREAGMNEFKLKAGFRQMFGMGLFAYHLNERMKEAHRLLESTNKPIKAIATLTGYERITSFITAFRKFFGYTPSAVRKS